MSLRPSNYIAKTCLEAHLLFKRHLSLTKFPGWWSNLSLNKAGEDLKRFFFTSFLGDKMRDKCFGLEKLPNS
jgi:hypothetical protein